MERAFAYVAIDHRGRRVKGQLAASSESAAFEQLKRQGLAPVRLRSGAGRSGGGHRRASDREATEFLSDLAALLEAGSDMWTALTVIGSKADSEATKILCGSLTADIREGAALETAFSRAFGRSHPFVPALVAAGESSGDLAAGLARAAELLSSRVRLRDQLVSVLSYPAFILATSLAAFGVILFVVIPALAPLVQQPGVSPPLLIMILIAASSFLRSYGIVLAVLGAAAVVGLAASFRLGVLSKALDQLLLDGPFRRTVRSLTFGAFSITLGNLLAAGTPMDEALRLGGRSISSPAARTRIEQAAQQVRQGQRLSDVLAEARGFPQSILRLAGIGEATGALGLMIARAGKIEEEGALRRIEAAGRLIGPAAIVLLGGLIGLLMGGLLMSMTQLGDIAVQ